MKYYQITAQELADIRKNLPNKIAFGFESYGAYFFSSETVDNIDKSHGSLLENTFKVLFGKDKATFLQEKESTSYESYMIQKQKNQDGFDAFEKIVGYITANNGLGTAIDTQIIPAYQNLTLIRMMLKDGMFESAFRYWITEIKPLNLIPSTAVTFIETILEGLCKRYGTTNTVITAIKTAPKGSI